MPASAWRKLHEVRLQCPAGVAEKRGHPIPPLQAVPDLRAQTLFFNDTATTEIYTLSLHDALPICGPGLQHLAGIRGRPGADHARGNADRKSTRLNSSHLGISYAVFCLKKKSQ